MAIKKYVASADTTITNAFRSNLTIRGTGSNAGLADTMEIFSIFAQASSSSIELSRLLVQFPVNDIISDRNGELLPSAGSVNFVLNLYNAEHGLTLPRNFTLAILPVSRSWEEGYGVDLDEYSDLTYDGDGANWVNASSGTQWTNQGGDYLDSPVYDQYFNKGIENLEIDITPLVEDWISSTVSNYGVGVALTSSLEGNSTRSFFTKRFFTRSSEFFFKRPTIEARWDDSTFDDRGNFYISSSLLPSAQNLHNLYLYNYFAGQFRNLPVDVNDLQVKLYTSASGGDEITSVLPSYPIPASLTSTGIYKINFSLDTTASIVYDIWSSGSTVFYTGSFVPLSYSAFNHKPLLEKYVVSMPDLETSYSNDETVRFRVHTRNKNWCPNVLTVASDHVELNIIKNMYYKISRIKDSLDVVPYGTGSTNHTLLSYDISGSYFDFDINLLEKDYAYGIKYIYKTDTGKFKELGNVFKFRVE